MDINGLFAAYRPKQMSVADYDNVAAEQQANQLNGLMMRQKFQQSQADMAEADAFKQALRGGADANGLMAASPTRAMAHQGALLKQQETQADIGYKQAQAGKIAFEQKQVLRGHALAGAEHVKTPADMGGLLGILEQSGDISKEQAAQIMQGVQQKPETIPQIVGKWQRAVKAGATPLEGPAYYACWDCGHKGPAVDCTGRTSEDCRADRALNAEMKRLWNTQPKDRP